MLSQGIDEACFLTLAIDTFEDDWQKLWQCLWRRSATAQPRTGAVWKRVLPNSFRQAVPIRNTSVHGDAGAKHKRNSSITRCVDELLASIASAEGHQSLGFLHSN